MLIVGHLCVCNFFTALTCLIGLKVISKEALIRTLLIQMMEKIYVESDEDSELTQMISGMTPLARLLSINSCILRAPLDGNGSLMAEHCYLNFPWLIS